MERSSRPFFAWFSFLHKWGNVWEKGEKAWRQFSNRKSRETWSNILVKTVSYTWKEVQGHSLHGFLFSTSGEMCEKRGKRLEDSFPIGKAVKLDRIYWLKLWATHGKKFKAILCMVFFSPQVGKCVRKGEKAWRQFSNRKSRETWSNILVKTVSYTWKEVQGHSLHGFLFSTSGEMCEKRGKGLKTVFQ